MITTYQIRHVLRTYGNQLRRKGPLLQASVVQPKTSDLVDISIAARRKQTVNKISNDLISKMPSDNRQLKAEGDNIVGYPPLNLENGGYGKTKSEEQI